MNTEIDFVTCLFLTWSTLHGTFFTFNRKNYKNFCTFSIFYFNEYFFSRKMKYLDKDYKGQNLNPIYCIFRIYLFFKKIIWVGYNLASIRCFRINNVSWSFIETILCEACVPKIISTFSKPFLWPLIYMHDLTNYI